MKIIENAKIIANDEIEIIDKGYLIIDEGKIREINSGSSGVSGKKIDAKNCIVIPGLINAHTHIGDSIAKEVGLGKTLFELVTPPSGFKHKILRETPEEQICSAINDSVLDMLSSGITTFADFREGGVGGIKILKKAIEKIRIRAHILGRPDFYFSENILEKNLSPLPPSTMRELDNVFRLADGVGLSSPNEFTDIALKQVADKVKGKGIISTHVCEHPKSSEVSFRRTGLMEVERAIKFLKADYLVHLTYATERDIERVAEVNVPVVCCPRANAVLGLGFPPIHKMIRQGIIVALGTDNVMINSPDLFREMDYVSKFIRAMEESPIFPSPIDVFKMVTINAARTLKIDDKVGSITEGKLADLVLIRCEDFNLRPIHDPFATIVHRARHDNIKMVMVNGEVCIDRL